MVQAGTLFGYLAAFITIVLGLALADLLTSFHRLLRARHRVVWRPLPILLALFVMLSLLTGFFGIWEMTRLEVMTYYGLAWQMVLYFPFFLAACAVLPDEVPAEGLDLDTFYFAERRYVLALLASVAVLDMTNVWITAWAEIAADPASVFDLYLLFNLIVLGLFALMAWSERKWVHWAALAVLFAIAHLGFSVWDIRGASALVAAAPALP